MNRILILLLVLIFSCSENSTKEKSSQSALIATKKDSSESSNVSLNDEKGNSSEDLSNYFSVCYTQQFNSDQSSYEHPRVEKGFIGTFRDQKIYYETWFYSNNLSMDIKYIILRTDTSKIEGYDFCFPELPSPPELKDSILCKRYDSKNDEWVIDTTLTINEVPTIIHPLVVALNGYQYLSGFNNDEKEGPKIYFKDNDLYLQFWDIPRYGEHRLIQWIYEFNSNKFKFIKEKVLETRENDNDNN